MKRTVITLDFMRFFAALAVVAYHFAFYGAVEKGPGGIGEILAGRVDFPNAGAFASWGWVGVYVFFVISGFVILMSAQGKTLFEFAVGRFVRIYPALIVFTTLSLLVLIYFSEVYWVDLVMRWGRALVLYPRGPWIDGAIWTLTIEAIFYCLIGLLLLSGLIGRAVTFAMIYLAVTSAFWLLVGVDLYASFGIGSKYVFPVASAYSSKAILLTTGQFFSLGMLLYDRFVNGNKRLESFFIGLAVCQGALAIYVFALRSPAVTVAGHSPLVPVLVWLAVILACIAATSFERTRLPSPLWRRLARKLGLLTYPVYLANQILGAATIVLFLNFGLGAIGATWLAFGAIIILSWVFSEYVEPSIRRWMQSVIAPARGRGDVERQDEFKEAV